MNKKTLGCLLLCFAFISSTTFAGKAPTRSKMGNAIFVMSTTNQCNITQKKLTSKDPILHLSMEYPEVHGLKDKTFQKKLNKQFKNNTLNKKNKLKKHLKKRSSHTDIPCEYIQTYNYTHPLDNYLTINFFEYRYTGEENSAVREDYVTIDLLEEKIITLKDLFIEDSNYIEQINAYLQQHLNGSEIPDDLLIENHTLPFYIDSNKNLVIVIHLNDFLPHATGIIKCHIPHNALNGYLLST